MVTLLSLLLSAVAWSTPWVMHFVWSGCRSMTCNAFWYRRSSTRMLIGAWYITPSIVMHRGGYLRYCIQ